MVGAARDVAALCVRFVLIQRRRGRRWWRRAATSAPGISSTRTRVEWERASGAAADASAPVLGAEKADGAKFGARTTGPVEVARIGGRIFCVILAYVLFYLLKFLSDHCF